MGPKTPTGIGLRYNQSIGKWKVGWRSWGLFLLDRRWNQGGNQEARVINPYAGVLVIRIPLPWWSSQTICEEKDGCWRVKKEQILANAERRYLPIPWIHLALLIWDWPNLLSWHHRLCGCGWRVWGIWCSLHHSLIGLRVPPGRNSSTSSTGFPTK